MNGVVAIGAATIDSLFHLHREPVLRTSNPARLVRSFGGVARNVAENLARLGIPVTLCSAVGDDEDGATLLAHLRAAGVDATCVAVVPGARTAQYAALVAPGGELFTAACDATVAECVRLDDRARARMAESAWVFLDGNVAPSTIERCIALRRESAWSLAIDATSVEKASAFPRDLSAVDLAFTNEDELRTLGAANPRCTVVTKGARGAVVLSKEGEIALDAPAANVIDVTGAGDALVAATLYALVHGERIVDAVRAGMRAASLTIESDGSVRADLTAELLR